MVKIDHYKVLDLPSGSEGAKLTLIEITKKYKAKALLLHPDKRLDYPHAGSEFQQLKESYDILKDPESRKKFDAALYFENMTSGDMFVIASGLSGLLVGCLLGTGTVCVVDGTYSLVKNVCVGTANSIGWVCNSVTRAVKNKESEGDIEVRSALISLKFLRFVNIS